MQCKINYRKPLEKCSKCLKKKTYVCWMLVLPPSLSYLPVDIHELWRVKSWYLHKHFHILQPFSSVVQCRMKESGRLNKNMSDVMKSELVRLKASVNWFYLPNFIEFEVPARELSQYRHIIHNRTLFIHEKNRREKS